MHLNFTHLGWKWSITKGLEIWLTKSKGRQWCQPEGHSMAPQTPTCLAFPFSKFTFHPWTGSGLPRNNNSFNPRTFLCGVPSLPWSFPLWICISSTESEDFFSSLSVVPFVLLRVEECEWQIFCGWILRVGHCRERVWPSPPLECVGNLIPLLTPLPRYFINSYQGSLWRVTKLGLQPLWNASSRK